MAGVVSARELTPPYEFGGAGQGRPILLRGRLVEGAAGGVPFAA